MATMDLSSKGEHELIPMEQMTARPLEHEEEDDYCGTSHSSISVDGDDDEGERLLARQKSNRVGFERSYAKARNKLRCIYFLGSFAYSIYLPFFVLFMKNEIGLSAGEVGLVGALQIVGGYLVGPPVSLLVDWLSVKVDCLKFRIHKYMWIASMLACTIPVQLIPLANNFASALVIAIMVSGLNAPVSSIQDASTLGFLGKESHEYGKIRFWGAIGWGLGSLMGGSIAQFFGMQYAFRLFGVGTVANAAIVLSLDFTTIQKAEESSAAGSAGGGGSSSDSVPFHHSIRRLVPTWSYALCLFVAVVAGFGGSSLQSLLLIFLSDLGAPDFLEGLALSVATISELPVFWASGYVIKRYGASSLLCASLLALTIRSILVSFLTNPWMVLPLQLLHGFTFAGTWTAGVALAKENSPVGLETSGQSVFSLSFNGIGGLSGAIVGGQLYDLVGARTMYRIKAMIFAATAILYALTLTKPKCCVK